MAFNDSSPRRGIAALTTLSISDAMPTKICGRWAPDQSCLDKVRAA